MAPLVKNEHQNANKLLKAAMSSFSQYAIESFLCLLLFYGYYRFFLKAASSFLLQRWFLRLSLVEAFLLPLFSLLSAEKQAILPGLETLSTTPQAWWPIELPEFSVSWSLLIRAVYFVGFMVAAFRLMDKIWAIGHFIATERNSTSHFQGLDFSATVAFSRLFFLWNKWDVQQKEQWAEKWRSLHPLAAWEALCVSFLLVFNWWNPLMHSYVKSWQELYAQESFLRKKGNALLQLSGAVGLAVSVVLAFAFLPSRLSPTALMGKAIAAWSSQLVFEYKKEEPHRYTLQWGKTSVLLKKLASPNGFGGEIEIELSDFQQILNTGAIEVYHGNKPLHTGILSILYFSKSSGDRAYINDIDPEKVILKDRRQGTVFNDSLHFGDEIVLFGEADQIYLTHVKFKIHDPFAAYEPVVKVPEINHVEANSSFQIIARAGKRALVKIDSASPGSWYIRELYSDPLQYEIVEIPGFRTNRRYLSESEALAALMAAPETLLVKDLPDIYYLPEFQNYQNTVVRLDWGSMSAMPSSQNYPVAVFSQATGRELRLQADNQTLEIAAFEIIITGKEVPSMGFLTDHLDHPDIQNALADLKPEASIYFDHLVVRDTDNVLKLFPVAFVFNIVENDAAPGAAR